MPRDEVLRSGTITVERADKPYTALYDVLKGGYRPARHGQATQIGGSTAEDVARMRLREIVDSGLADRDRLGR
jgi:hypothetical protein